MDFLSAPARGRATRAWRSIFNALIAVALLTARGVLAPAGAADLPEYRVKAVFLYNFAQFVTWPPQVFPDTQSPLVIGVLGDDPFGSDLDETVRGEKVNSRPLQIRHYRKPEEVGPCHILFISRSEADRAGQIIGSLKGRQILTVGDVESPAMRGVMIRFAMEKNKIRLKINTAAAKAADLTISSKLLRVADIVAP